MWHVSKRPLVIGSVIALAGVLGMNAAPSRAATAVSYSALLSQVKSGPVIRAVINPRRGDVEIKFRDLSEWEAFFPAGAQPALQRLLHQRRIRVLFASQRVVGKPKPGVVHHHLRYIAAAVIGAAMLIGGGAFAFVRRRRRTQPSAARSSSS
jgi:ATP-dependent Zn protease